MNRWWLRVGQDTGEAPYVDLVRPADLVVRTMGSNGLWVREHARQACYIDLIDAADLVSDLMDKGWLPCRA